MPSELVLAKLFAFAALLLLSAFFSGSETAFLSANKIRIRRMANDGNKKAIIAEELIRHQNRLLVTILIGNNVVNIAAASVATSIAIEAFHSWGIGIATGVTTLLVLMIGEITPKSLAAGNAERITLAVARPLALLVGVMYPIAHVLASLTRPLVRILGGEAKLNKLFTEEEFRIMVEVGVKEGVIEKEEKEMIHGIMELGETEAREVMAPRIDIVAVESTSSIEEAIDLVQKSGHSRLPVYEGSRDNIAGVIDARDLLRAVQQKKAIKEVMRPVFYVPETKKLDELLEEMRERKTQIAIVVDEYGGTAGLITIEDLMEEIVGEIVDEYAIEETPILRVDESTTVVNAKLNIGDLNDTLGLKLPEEKFDTVGGLIFNVLGKIPTVGERVEINGLTLTVEKMRGRRITKVRVVKTLKIG